MLIRQFGTSYRGNGWSFKWPSNEIADLNLVPVPGLVLDFIASSDIDSADQERLASLVETVLAAVEQQQWADQCNMRILLIEWHSDLVLTGLPRQFEARDIQDVISDSVSSGEPSILSRKRFIERFAVDVSRLSP